MINYPIKGKYLKKYPLPQGDFASNMIELNLLVQQLQSIKNDATLTVNSKILELEKKVSDKIEEIEKVIKDNKKFDNILQNTKGEVLELIAKIKKGDKGEDGKDVDVESLEKSILSKIPKINIKSLAKSVIEIIPENKSSLKIIQETFESDPLIVANKIVELMKEGKFKLKKEHIDGLEQTISVLNNQLSTKIGGGGFSNIYKDGVLVSNGLTGLNFTGIDITSVTKNSSTGIITVTISAADISVSLADVSTNSTTAPLSLYTMTSTIPVEFRTSGGSPLLYLDESNARVGIGDSSPDARLDILQGSDTETQGFQITRSNDSNYTRMYKKSALGSLNDPLVFSSDFVVDHAAIGRDGGAYFAGNVGIGTTSPGAKLDVAGDLRLTTSGARFDIMKNLTDSASRRNWGLNTEVNAVGDFGIYESATNTTQPSVNRLTILSGGNVGIGTTSPGYLLEVYSSARRFSAGSDGVVRWNQDSYGGLLTWDTDVAFIDTNVSTPNLAFKINASEKMRITTAGNVGIGTTTPTNILSLGGNSSRIAWMERHTTANTAGNTLTITAGGATSGATDKNGGDLLLQGGLSTGTGESGVQIYGCVAGASGTTDRTQTLGIQMLGNKLGFFAVTPVTRQTELTDELTTITFTSPGTPDYAIQNLTHSSPFGFATQDEGNTVLSVIANLQARVNELETKLTAYGLLIDAD